MSARISYDHYQGALGIKVDQAYFVSNVDEWETALKQLQDQVDYIYIENPEALHGWELERAKRFVNDNGAVPIGSNYEWLASLSLFTISNIPQEQGWWATQMATEILAGRKPSNIAIVKNKEGKLLTNLRLANKLGIRLSTDILQTAQIVEIEDDHADNVKLSA